VLCQQNLISPHKYLVMTQQKYAVSVSRSTTYFDPTLTDCLSCVDYDRHLVSVSSSGKQFGRCVSIIDLTQYWILEYTFSRWSSQQNMLCQQNLTELRYYDAINYALLVLCCNTSSVTPQSWPTLRNSRGCCERSGLSYHKSQLTRRFSHFARDEARIAAPGHFWIRG